MVSVFDVGAHMLHLYFLTLIFYNNSVSISDLRHKNCQLCKQASDNTVSARASVNSTSEWMTILEADHYQLYKQLTASSASHWGIMMCDGANL